MDKVLTLRGEFKLLELRDQARTVANLLDMQPQFTRLDGLIGALLGTHGHKRLTSRQALARAAGCPYDPGRLEIFDALFTALQEAVFPLINDQAPQGHALENFAFFKAHFSNFIEGTTFDIKEAEQIVFAGQIIQHRSADSHDILGTFRAASQPPWRNCPPANADDFLRWLKSVNALVMEARPDQQPGEWKQVSNQAGNTFFVTPELVPGTLQEGFARIAALADPLARALMTMFVVTEVHPFADGNGRTARLAMNCLLSAHGMSRIIIPTVYREDYRLPLKALSNHLEATAYLRAMTRAQQWTASLDYEQPRQNLCAQFERCNAFQEDLKNYKLVVPE